MFQTFANAWKISDLRKKILWTIGLLLVFRFGSFIPVPYMDASKLKELVGQGGNLFGLLDIFTGGGFSNATIFAMSITPYINSSIIMQLLTVAIPGLEKLVKEGGEEGRKVIAQWTRYLTVVLAFIQAAGLYVGLQGVVTQRGVLSFIVITFSFTAGTAFLMWLGEQINEKGVGNGISLLIFAGIVSRGPALFNTLVTMNINRSLNWITTILLLVAGVAVIAIVVLVNNSERRIPIQYAKRVVGRKMYGGQSSHLPIKVSMAGVMPIIFAVSIMSFPSTLAQLLGAKMDVGFWKYLSPSGWIYALLYFVMIIFFTYFYTSIQFNPVEVSNNLKKNGGFVPGIRPGRSTSDFITMVLSRVTFIGAIFLALIAVMPIVMTNQFGMGIAFGGTSILIMVGVALETVKQLESQMLMRHYKGFLD